MCNRSHIRSGDKPEWLVRLVMRSSFGEVEELVRLAEAAQKADEGETDQVAAWAKLDRFVQAIWARPRHE